jgi:hypothetical protein
LLWLSWTWPCPVPAPTVSPSRTCPPGHGPVLAASCPGQVGYTDLLIDPANGCLDGCEPLGWPALSELPPALSALAVGGAFDLVSMTAASSLAAPPASGPLPPRENLAETGRGPRGAGYLQGAPVRMLALTHSLAPPGADLTAACSEHDRCYATWRRGLGAEEYRAACDSELLLNLAYACAAPARLQAQAAGATPHAHADSHGGAWLPSTLPSAGCDALVRLTHHLATSGAGSHFERAQAAALIAAVDIAN